MIRVSTRWFPRVFAGLVGLGMVAGLAGSIPEPTPSRVEPGRQTPTSQPSGSEAAPVRVVPMPLAALRPGVGHRLNVTVENPNPKPVVLTGVEVQVSEVRTPRASSARPCGLADFTTRPGQFGSLELAPGASVSLAEARIPHEEWPWVGMIDTDTNQDGCQDAQLALDVRVEGWMP